MGTHSQAEPEADRAPTGTHPEPELGHWDTPAELLNKPELAVPEVTETQGFPAGGPVFFLPLLCCHTVASQCRQSLLYKRGNQLRATHTPPSGSSQSAELTAWA